MAQNRNGEEVEQERISKKAAEKSCSANQTTNRR